MCATPGSTGILLLIGVGSSLCYAYDYDAARWYHWTAGFTDAATVHNPSSTEELQLWAARSLFGTYIMQWLRKTPVWSDHTGIQAADFDP